MLATIDESGRLEIPRVFRDRLRFSAGTIVDVDVVDDTLHIKVPGEVKHEAGRKATLRRDGTMLVIDMPGTLTVEEVNDAIQMGRHERFLRIIGEDSNQ